MALSQTGKVNLAIKGNEMMLMEFDRFLHGYPEEEKIIEMKLSDEDKLTFLISAFTTILGKLKETDPEILSDPFIRAALTNAIQIPSSKSYLWRQAIMKAEDGLA